MITRRQKFTFFLSLIDSCEIDFPPILFSKSLYAFIHLLKSLRTYMVAIDRALESKSGSFYSRYQLKEIILSERYGPVTNSTRRFTTPRSSSSTGLFIRVQHQVSPRTAHLHRV